MLRLFVPAALLLLPVTGMAQINAAANLEVPNPPLRANAVFNGLMLSNDTEFLTPEGILDDLPQQAILQQADYATIEPAAGPAGDPSSTDPSPTLPQ